MNVDLAAMDGRNGHYQKRRSANADFRYGSDSEVPLVPNASLVSFRQPTWTLTECLGSYGPTADMLTPEL